MGVRVCVGGRRSVGVGREESFAGARLPLSTQQPKLTLATPPSVTVAFELIGETSAIQTDYTIFFQHHEDDLQLLSSHRLPASSRHRRVPDDTHPQPCTTYITQLACDHFGT